MNIEYCMNEIPDTVTPLETVERSGITVDEKDQIYEQVNELKHQVAEQEAVDSKVYQKYDKFENISNDKVENISKSVPLKDVHDIHEEKVSYFDNDRECLCICYSAWQITSSILTSLARKSKSWK